MAYYIWLLPQLRRLIIWSVLDNPPALYFPSPLCNFAPCTKPVDSWKLLLLSLYFSEIVEFPMHSMGILSQQYSPIVLGAMQVYFLLSWFFLDLPFLQEILCIVEFSQSHAHPFRRTRDAVAGHEDFTVTHSPWTDRWVIITIICFSSLLTPVRLHVTYHRLIPAIEVIPVHLKRLSTWSKYTQIEILPAGETGPRHLDTSTVMKIQNVPFLSVSEFVRAKLKTWVMYTCLSCLTCYLFWLNGVDSRGSERDAQDIVFMLSRYWNRIDINRITEQDMNLFVARNISAAASWIALKRKYGM